MLIDFDQIEEIAIPNLNQGAGLVSRSIYFLWKKEARESQGGSFTFQQEFAII